MKKPVTKPKVSSIDSISEKIFVLRGQKVILDKDLASLYHVETKVLKQVVRRHIHRFPKDFMFDLTQREWKILRSQIVTSSWGGTRYTPSAFTEQGVAMLSGVLNSRKAIGINIRIMRVFVKMRQLTNQYRMLLQKIERLEASDEKQNQALKSIIIQLAEIIDPPYEPMTPIGFRVKADD